MDMSWKADENGFFLCAPGFSFVQMTHIHGDRLDLDGIQFELDGWQRPHSCFSLTAAHYFKVRFLPINGSGRRTRNIGLSTPLELFNESDVL
jgi:hypothetical protein